LKTSAGAVANRAGFLLRRSRGQRACIFDFPIHISNSQAVIASEAKQFISPRKKEWIASAFAEELRRTSRRKGSSQ
jgi:hypothetical protein